MDGWIGQNGDTIDLYHCMVVGVRWAGLNVSAVFVDLMGFSHTTVSVSYIEVDGYNNRRPHLVSRISANL